MTDFSPTSDSVRSSLSAVQMPLHTANSFHPASNAEVRFFTGSKATLLDWLSSKTESGTAIAVCNTHMISTAMHDSVLCAALERFNFAICDGQPVAWLVGHWARRSVARITGPEIFEHIVNERLDQLRIVLVWGDEAKHADLAATLSEQQLRNVLQISPGWVKDGQGPNDDLIAMLLAFKPHIVFVGLGCPKQEKWIAQAVDRVPAHFLGVGAAFDYRLGRLQRAPALMQRLGAEWVFRAVQQPQLARRYLTTALPFARLLASAVVARLRPGNSAAKTK